MNNVNPENKVYPSPEWFTLSATEIIRIRTENYREQLAQPHIHFLLDNTARNISAYASRDSITGIPRITVSLGTTISFAQLFGVMLCHSEIFPQIGDVSKETVPWKLSSLSTDMFNYLYEDSTGHIIRPLALPKDIERLKLTVSLASSAWHFLIMHEFFHHARAHIDFLYETTGANFISEVGWNSSDGLTFTAMQALEFDADDCAIQECIITIYRRCRDFPKDPDGFRSRHGDLYSEPATALYYWAFAIFLLFRLIWNDSVDYKLLTGQTHPPAQLRQTRIIFRMCRIVTKNYPEWNIDCLSLMRAVIRDVEAVSALITNQYSEGMNLDPEAMNEVFDPRAMNYLDETDAHLHDILPELERLIAKRKSPSA